MTEKRIAKNIVIILTTFCLLFTSCKKNSSNPVTSNSQGSTSGNIQTGTTVTVNTSTVTPTGGTIKISSPGSPVNGMTITIPANAYSDNRSFSVSYAPIKSHNFGSNFNPISPMIIIKNGGGYSSDMMTVKIPIRKADDEFAMGFLYNEVTGKLEGLPVIDLTDSTITVGTRHFETSTISLGKRTNGQDLTSVGNLIITSIKDSYLTGQSIINTGFQPGIDDWEFTNYGSYIADGGQCAGQSISAMYYYYEKKLHGAPGLFHHFDKYWIKSSKGDSLWMDNPLGYRFASMVQNNIWTTSLVAKIKSAMQSKSLQYLSWKAFAVSMLLTGEPQYVALVRSDTIRHAIIAYKISLSENKLYVADPNYPGQERVITFNGLTFDPYSTKQNQNQATTKAYDGVGYLPKTALIDWDKITSLYTDFTNGTIGNGTFPAYSILVKDGADTSPFNDAMTVTKDTLNLVCKSTGATQFYIGTDRYQRIEIWDTTAKRLALGAAATHGIATLKLKPGTNKIGIYANGSVDNSDQNFLDFKWVTVKYQPLSIDPNPFTGQPNVQYTWKALTKGSAPKSAKYVWTFGDSTARVTQTNDSTVTHTYTAEGTYTITVDLYDNSTNTKISEATSTAQISTSIVPLLQNTIVCVLQYQAMINFQTGDSLVLKIEIDNNSSGSSIVWSGTSFSLTKSWSSWNGPYNRYDRTITISGNLTSDGRKVNTATAAYQQLWYEVSPSTGDATLFETTKEKITANNIPNTSVSDDKKTIGYVVLGPNIQPNLGTFEYSDSFTDGTPPHVYASTRWNSPQAVPTLVVGFIAP
jgi:PKD domain